MPEVGFDYAFVRRESEEETATLLVMKDRDSRAIRAWVVPVKGVGSDMAHAVSRAVEGVHELGHRGPVVVKTDNEAALLALREAIMAQMHEGAIPVQPVPGESESNGVTESGVRLFKGLLRVHLAALERKAGVMLPSGHPVTAWLVEHVADVLTKHLVGSDGHTAYERLFGKQAREEGLEFGEQVLHRMRRAQDMNVVLDGRWEPGTWLGRRWGSTVYRVHAHGKVTEVRAVQRRPAPERWVAAELAAVRATPWLTDPGPAADGAEPAVRHCRGPRAPPSLRCGPTWACRGGSTSARRTWNGMATQPAAGAAGSCARAAAVQASASPTTRGAASGLSEPCGPQATCAWLRPRSVSGAVRSPRRLRQERQPRHQHQQR